MAVIKRQFVLASGIISGIAAIIACVSLGTEYWVESDLSLSAEPGASVNTIRYGLFSGVYRQEDAVGSTFAIMMTCALDKNACAILCGTDEIRFKMLDDFYNNQAPTYNITNCDGRIALNQPFLHAHRTPRADTDTSDLRFINGGVWISTVVFLCISAALGFGCAGLAVWNTASNPILSLFSIFGLYIYNAAAFCAILLAILLWGGMFADSIIHNVAFYDTLSGLQTSDNKATLGYSYWILLVSLFLYCVSIAVLYIRQYLISKEPKQDFHLEENSDPRIYLY